MVFSDGKSRSLVGILKVIKDFAVGSGLRINLEKSTLYMSGVSDSSRDEILARFSFGSGSLHVRYTHWLLKKKIYLMQGVYNS